MSLEFMCGILYFPKNRQMENKKHFCRRQSLLVSSKSVLGYRGSPGGGESFGINAAVAGARGRPGPWLPVRRPWRAIPFRGALSVKTKPLSHGPRWRTETPATAGSGRVPSRNQVVFIRLGSSPRVPLGFVFLVSHRHLPSPCPLVLTPETGVGSDTWAEGSDPHCLAGQCDDGGNSTPCWQSGWTSTLGSNDQVQMGPHLLLGGSFSKPTFLLCNLGITAVPHPTGC